MLKKWQNKPEHVRERIAYTATIATFVVLVLFWVWTLNFRFSDTSGGAAQANAFHPFSLLKNSVSGIYGDVKDGISGKGTQFKNTDLSTGSLVPVYDASTTNTPSQNQ